MRCTKVISGGHSKLGIKFAKRHQHKRTENQSHLSGTIFHCARSLPTPAATPIHLKGKIMFGRHVNASLPQREGVTRLAVRLPTLATVGLCLLTCIPANGWTQTYPVRPIRLVVTAAPGGGDDFQGRLVAQGLSELLGQQCLVDNRPGGGAMIGREFVARALPDGYTILLAGGAMGAIPALRPAAKLDVLRDFTPLSQISSYPLVLVVHPSVPAKSVKELIALGRARQGKLTYGSSGVGQMPNLSMELFKSMAKIDILHVPYKGSAPAYTELMSGSVDLLFSVVASAMPQIRNEKVRPLGVTTAKRATILPDTPTITESGLPGYEMPSWMGVYGPPGMPREIVSRLNSSLHKIMAMPDVIKRMQHMGLEPETNSPEQMAERLKQDVGRLGKIIRDAGIKIE
jgi:tripartite-type tricarboxylate transporter receptor subunit TctC